jgi:hypothetical protein
MLHWSIEVLEDGKRAALFELPGTVEKAAVIDLMRLLTAKSLTFNEIAGCIWSKAHGRLGLLDVDDYDEGRTLACGHGLINVYARYLVKAP